ncbi:MAG TPA: DinB family protein [Bacillales bacterium]|nr:DinB family protein [Bacillales bacterium]
MQDVLKQQYEMIRKVREHLFDFMEHLPLEKLHEKVPGFGIDSMMGAHLHAANSYRYWIDWFASKRHPSEFKDISELLTKKADVQKDREIFAAVDETVERFIDKYHSCWLEEIEHAVEENGQPMRLTPLFLLSHVETHEFHHKGQIVAMARHLGFDLPPYERLGALFA